MILYVRQFLEKTFNKDDDDWTREYSKQEKLYSMHFLI